MRFDEYLKEEQLINENIILDTIKKIAGKPANTVMKMFKDGYKKFVAFLEKDQMTMGGGIDLDKVLGIINKAYGTNYKNIGDLKKQINASLKESTELNEDWARYWDLIKGEAFPALSFFPALTVWLEIDKIIRSSGDANARVIIVYGLIWLLLISGKFIKGFKKWKKEHPEEYYEERPKKAAKITRKAEKAAIAAKKKSKQKELEKWEVDREHEQWKKRTSAFGK
jgi:hypothetical protein